MAKGCYETKGDYVIAVRDEQFQIWMYMTKTARLTGNKQKAARCTKKGTENGVALMMRLHPGQEVRAEKV